MNRREMIGALGLGTAALTLAEGRAIAAQQDHHGHGAHDEHLSVMAECAKTCNETAHHCMEAICNKDGDVASHAEVHNLAMDCQAFCVLSASMMARHSPLARFAHEANAEACAACAEACEKHKNASEIVKKCQESCRKCEKVCREAAKQGHDHH